MQLTRSISDVARFRELLWLLAWRDIRVRYKHSLLGAAWAIAPPLLTMLTFLFLLRNGFGMARPLAGQALPYPLYALLGLMPWSFFSNSMAAASQSLVTNRNLIVKLYFPREVFPLAAMAACGVDFVVSMVVCAGVAIYLHASGGWTFVFGPHLLWFPVAVLVQCLFMVGLSLALAMANLYYRDVGYVVRAMLPLMMLVSDVVYPIHSGQAWINMLVAANPMAVLSNAYRCGFDPSLPSPAAGLAYVGLLSILLVVAAASAFERCEHVFAERA